MDSVLALTIVLSVFLSLSESLLVQTQYGMIQGRIRFTDTQIAYNSFQRVPYARPPIGALRFRDAIPPIAWHGQAPRDCTEEGPPFWGINEGQFTGTLDALHLNVYTNNLNPSTPFPVMVFIHGGGWQSGSGNTDFYGPDYLMEQNVTIVTINYRLGAFGFLSLDSPELNVPGNQAFKDQRMALRWVQNNIANFGGDPQRVTLFGQMTGGGSVHYHMISESSRGLFHRGILMAGTALHNGYSEIPRRNWARQLVHIMGSDATLDGDILTFLENADPIDIVTAQFQLLSVNDFLNEGILIPFGPTVEPYTTAGVFLDDEIPKLVRQAWGNNISIIIGATSKEGLPLLPEVRDQPILMNTVSNFEIFIPRELNISRNTDESRRYAAILKEAYYGKLSPSLTNIDGILTVQSDVQHWHPTHRTIRYRLEANGAPTYVYRFDADSQNNIFTNSLPQDMVRFYRQPSHFDDIAHLFRSKMHLQTNQMNQVSYNTLQLMVSLFTNFAEDGIPGHPIRDLPHWPVIWPHVGQIDNYDGYLVGLNIKENQTSFGVLPEASRTNVFDRITEMHRNGAATFCAFGLLQFSILIFMKQFIL